MSPTYTMSAHLCKQVYTSWRQARQGPPSPTADGAATAPTSLLPSARRSPSPEKRSMDSDRGDASTAPSSPASPGWRWGSR